VEEAAAAAQSMREQAADLLRAVSVFKLDGHAAQAETRVPAQARAPSPPSAPPARVAGGRAAATARETARAA